MSAGSLGQPVSVTSFAVPPRFETIRIRFPARRVTVRLFRWETEGMVYATADAGPRLGRPPVHRLGRIPADEFERVLGSIVELSLLADLDDGSPASGEPQLCISLFASAGPVRHLVLRDPSLVQDIEELLGAFVPASRRRGRAQAA